MSHVFVFRLKAHFVSRFGALKSDARFSHWIFVALQRYPYRCHLFVVEFLECENNATRIINCISYQKVHNSILFLKNIMISLLLVYFNDAQIIVYFQFNINMNVAQSKDSKDKEEFECPTNTGNGNFADPVTCRRFYQVFIRMIQLFSCCYLIYFILVCRRVSIS